MVKTLSEVINIKKALGVLKPFEDNPLGLITEVYQQLQCQRPSEPRESLLLVLQGLRELPHQRRDGHDLIALGQLRVHEQIDHLDAVATRHVLFAQLAEVGEGGHGLGCAPGDIEAQLPYLRWSDGG